MYLYMKRLKSNPAPMCQTMYGTFLVHIKELSLITFTLLCQKKSPLVIDCTQTTMQCLLDNMHSFELSIVKPTERNTWSLRSTPEQSAANTHEAEGRHRICVMHGLWQKFNQIASTIVSILIGVCSCSVFKQRRKMWFYTESWPKSLTQASHKAKGKKYYTHVFQSPTEMYNILMCVCGCTYFMWPRDNLMRHKHLKVLACTDLLTST